MEYYILEKDKPKDFRKTECDDDIYADVVVFAEGKTVISWRITKIVDIYNTTYEAEMAYKKVCAEPCRLALRCEEQSLHIGFYATRKYANNAINRIMHRK